ncbi:hypothetical protein OPW32_22910 [Vibrio europaeus]|uniref:hypothetical protein n=1 Tax=Vibrio europaeus TaxID=300876 RepID=UPI0023426827|nr:hypothetical protein [Vibrio europaeus]MDC5852046.1 hypothetical protein [Vibrio europaeus]
MSTRAAGLPPTRLPCHFADHSLHKDQLQFSMKMVLACMMYPRFNVTCFMAIEVDN